MDRLPSTLRGWVSLLAAVLPEPILRDAAWLFIKEFFGYNKQRVGKISGDESVAAFFSWRLNQSIVDNLGSALAHGTYAGNPDKLSVKSIVYHMWYQSQQTPAENRNLAMVRKRMQKKLMPGDDYDAIFLAAKDAAKRNESARFEEIILMGKDILGFNLQGGMVQLVDRLAEVLASANNVEVITDASIEKISGSYKSQMEVQLADGSSQKHDHLISTISPQQLANQLQGPSGEGVAPINETVQLLSSKSNYAVTVMVVNLYYDKPNLTPVHGFGYLIPTSAPLVQNPERALGVIFGSESNETSENPQGTKLTVMLGGHWWDGWKEGDYPDEQTAIEMSRNLVERHLNITETPSFSAARLQRNAIPQPTVGHHDRMGQLDRALRHDYGDKLKVGGAWYTGISLNSCIRTGSLLGLRLRHPEPFGTTGTGLGTFSAPDGFGTNSSPLRLVDSKGFWLKMLLVSKGKSDEGPPS